MMEEEAPKIGFFPKITVRERDWSNYFGILESRQTQYPGERLMKKEAGRFFRTWVFCIVATTFRLLALWQKTGYGGPDSWCGFVCLSEIEIVSVAAFDCRGPGPEAGHCFKPQRLKWLPWLLPRGFKDTYPFPLFLLDPDVWGNLCQATGWHGDDQKETSVIIHDREYAICKKLVWKSQ